MLRDLDITPRPLVRMCLFDQIKEKIMPKVRILPVVGWTDAFLFDGDAEAAMEWIRASGADSPDDFALILWSRWDNRWEGIGAGSVLSVEDGIISHIPSEEMKGYVVTPCQK